jgi:hypothetical protein
MTTRPVATALRVGLLPTLPFHAGVSMQVYASGLMESLEHVPGVRAELLTPPFLGGPAPGWSRSRWIRYVAYPRWAASQRADVYHVVDHGNAQLLWRLPRHRTSIRSRLRAGGCTMPARRGGRACSPPACGSSLSAARG